MYFKGEKICLVTGANSGIGKAAAKGLADLGATVILVCRNHTRGEKTLSELKEITGNKKLYLFLTDLSSQLSISDLVQNIKNKFHRLDVLINNAGACFSKRHITVDGIEATFAVNYLSRFVLTNFLLDLLLKSRNGRIINVSGESHRKGKINFEDPGFLKNYSPLKAVSQTKLADILFTYELARKLKDKNITVNCLHPGFIKTNIIYNDPDASIIKKGFYRFSTLFSRSPEKGAETVIYLASSPEASNVSGHYFINKKSVESSPESYDENLAKRLWFLSRKMVKIELPEILAEQKNVLQSNQ